MPGQMPPDMKESKAGEIYADFPEDAERRSQGLKYLKRGLKNEQSLQPGQAPGDGAEAGDEEEPEPQGFRVLVAQRKGKGKANPKQFMFEVIDPAGNQSTVRRSLGDLAWLRENLQKDFPYSYVA